MKPLRRGFCAVSAVLLLLTLAPASQAQEEGPTLLSVATVKVRPDMVAEWTDLIKNEVNPALQKAGVPSRFTWRTAVFGDSYEFVSVRPMENFAQLDSPGPLVEALGEEGMIRLIRKLQKCITSREVAAVVTRPDLSIPPTGPPALATVISVDVASGKQQEFEALVRDELLPAIKKAGSVGYFVGQTVFGGNPNNWTFVSLFGKFAELDQGSPLVRVLGQEGAQELIAKTAGLVDNVEFATVRYVADLSFGLEMETPGSE